MHAASLVHDLHFCIPVRGNFLNELISKRTTRLPLQSRKSF